MSNNPAPINFFGNADGPQNIIPQKQQNKLVETETSEHENESEPEYGGNDKDDARFRSTVDPGTVGPLPTLPQPEEREVRRIPFPKVRTIDRKMVDAVNQMSHRPADQASLTIAHSFLNQKFGYNIAELCNQAYEPPDVTNALTPQTVHLCLYLVNTKVPTSPFLEFALEGSSAQENEQSKKEFRFPAVAFAYTESAEDPHAQFTSACYQKIFELMAVEPTPEMTIDHIASLTQFRGIYTNDSEQEQVYAFFEISPAYADTLTTSTLTWTTIHEIANTQTVRDVPVAAATQLVFTLEPELMYIKNEIGVPVNIPFVLYATEMSPDGTFALLPNASVLVPQFEHPFGYYSFFSDYAPSSLPQSEENAKGSQISRYVVFTDNILYLVGTEEENKKTHEQTWSNMHFSGIYFQDATSTPRWGVRTVDAYMLLD